MANEATPIEGPYEKHDFTVATGTAITQHTVMQLSDPRTAAASDGANVFAGIAVFEKTTTDGVTEMSCYTRGTFNMKPVAGHGITAGSLVSLSGANLIKLATEAEVVTGAAFGRALETPSTTEEIEVQLLF